MLYFSIQHARGGRKKYNLGCEAGCGRRFHGRIGLGSWSDRSRNGLGMVSERSRIGRALEMTFQLFSRNLCAILESPFAWQAQYLVSLDNDTCYSAHCK